VQQLPGAQLRLSRGVLQVLLQAPVKGLAQRLTAQLTTPGLELARREGETESRRHEKYT